MKNFLTNGILIEKVQKNKLLLNSDMMCVRCVVMCGKMVEFLFCW